MSRASCFSPSSPSASSVAVCLGAPFSSSVPFGCCSLLSAEAPSSLLFSRVSKSSAYMSNSSAGTDLASSLRCATVSFRWIISNVSSYTSMLPLLVRISFERAVSLVILALDSSGAWPAFFNFQRWAVVSFAVPLPNRCSARLTVSFGSISSSICR
uniref:Putative secreted protein n=1 Tax=Anopheles darlingi TaxID=43151 RepID=A0A2M4D8D0_ANODA